jgi:hypothetical protein
MKVLMLWYMIEPPILKEISVEDNAKLYAEVCRERPELYGGNDTLKFMEDIMLKGCNARKAGL